MWFLENVFYHSASRIYSYIQQHILEDETVDNTLFQLLGFGRVETVTEITFVTPKETSLKTAERFLKYTIQRNYYRDLRRLKRKITFDIVDEKITALEQGTVRHALKSEW